MAVKRCTLRNGIVVDFNGEASDNALVISVPENYHDKNGRDWEVGDVQVLLCDGTGGAWGQEYDIVNDKYPSENIVALVKSLKKSPTISTTKVLKILYKEFPGLKK